MDEITGEASRRRANFRVGSFYAFRNPAPNHQAHHYPPAHKENHNSLDISPMEVLYNISGRFTPYRGLTQAKSLRTFTTSRRISNEALKPQFLEYFEGRLVPNIAQHDCYILLHSSQSPASFPKVFNTPLSIELQRRASKWGGLVNFSWFGEESVSPPNTQPATVFSHLGGRLEIPDVSLENLDRVESTIRSHLRGPLTDLTTQGVHVYVCTHGARDCRCGERGRSVLRALQEAVQWELQRHPDGPANHIKVGEVGHVGGHKLGLSLPRLGFRISQCSFLDLLRISSCFPRENGMSM